LGDELYDKKKEVLTKIVRKVVTPSILVVCKFVVEGRLERKGSSRVEQLDPINLHSIE